MGSRFSASFINAQDLLSRIVALPGGGVIVQLYAPGVGDLNLYFPRLEAASAWWGALANRLSDYIRGEQLPLAGNPEPR